MEEKMPFTGRGTKRPREVVKDTVSLTSSDIAGKGDSESSRSGDRFRRGIVTERKDSVEDEPDESADDANGTGVSGKDKSDDSGVEEDVLNKERRERSNAGKHGKSSKDALSNSTLQAKDGSSVRGENTARNERTCTSCRKSKVKCDRRAPCTRCVRLKMECIAQTRGRGRPLSAVRAGRRPYPADKPCPSYLQWKSVVTTANEPQDGKGVRLRQNRETEGTKGQSFEHVGGSAKGQRPVTHPVFDPHQGIHLHPTAGHQHPHYNGRHQGQLPMLGGTRSGGAAGGGGPQPPYPEPPRSQYGHHTMSPPHPTMNMGYGMPHFPWASPASFRLSPTPNTDNLLYPPVMPVTTSPPEHTTEHQQLAEALTSLREVHLTRGMVGVCPTGNLGATGPPPMTSNASGPQHGVLKPEDRRVRVSFEPRSGQGTAPLPAESGWETHNDFRGPGAMHRGQMGLPRVTDMSPMGAQLSTSSLGESRGGGGSENRNSFPSILGHGQENSNDPELAQTRGVTEAQMESSDALGALLAVDPEDKMMKSFWRMSRLNEMYRPKAIMVTRQWAQLALNRQITNLLRKTLAMAKVLRVDMREILYDYKFMAMFQDLVRKSESGELTRQAPYIPFNVPVDIPPYIRALASNSGAVSQRIVILGQSQFENNVMWTELFMSSDSANRMYSTNAMDVWATCIHPEDHEEFLDSLARQLFSVPCPFSECSHVLRCVDHSGVDFLALVRFRCYFKDGGDYAAYALSINPLPRSRHLHEVGSVVDFIAEPGPGTGIVVRSEGGPGAGIGSEAVVEDMGRERGMDSPAYRAREEGVPISQGSLLLQQELSRHQCDNGSGEGDRRLLNQDLQGRVRAVGLNRIPEGVDLGAGSAIEPSHVHREDQLGSRMTDDVTGVHPGDMEGMRHGLEAGSTMSSTGLSDAGSLLDVDDSLKDTVLNDVFDIEMNHGENGGSVYFAGMSVMQTGVGGPGVGGGNMRGKDGNGNGGDIGGAGRCGEGRPLQVANHVQDNSFSNLDRMSLMSEGVSR